MRAVRTGVLLLVCVACSATAHADTVVIDFEGLADQEVLAAQFQSSDVQFSDGMVALSGLVGGLLNEFDYPPASGDAVAINTADAMVIDFLRPVIHVAGRFTYAGGPLTLTGRSGVSDVVSASSGATENLASVGVPNDYIALDYAAGLTSLVIGGLPGITFTLDDLEVEFAAGTPMPEPTTTLLVGVALVAAARRWRAA